MAGAAAIIGLLLAGGGMSEQAILIFLIVFLITGAGNAINDYFDWHIDAVNRPWRPIPSGRVSPRIIVIWSISLFALGIILASQISQICLGIAGLNSILLFFYARNLKATPLVGNISVSYLTGSTFLFGGAAYGLAGLWDNMVPFILSCLVTMSREIAKDIEDIDGDRQGGAKTLPILAGIRFSAALAAAFALAGIGLSYIAKLGTVYVIVISVANLLFLASIRMILLKGDASESQKLLKMGMAVALLAFLAGAYTI
jgi:geranylgeranylglycerol-phosphate geranylgeranyltransferase